MDNPLPAGGGTDVTVILMRQNPEIKSFSFHAFLFFFRRWCIIQSAPQRLTLQRFRCVLSCRDANASCGRLTSIRLLFFIVKSSESFGSSCLFGIPSHEEGQRKPRAAWKRQIREIRLKVTAVSGDSAFFVGACRGRKNGFSSYLIYWLSELFFSL